jgi:Holliday junction resolvasome RuvABC DNA-binding subunit
MLDAVRGTVESVEDGTLLLNLGAVTLEMLVPGYFAGELTRGEELEVFTHFQLVSEGNRVLPLAVAFPCPADRAFFRSFITVSGVGARAAARALQQPPGAVASAISRGDIGFLKALPGIGAARARQIVAKLQEAMSSFQEGAGAGVPCSGGRSEALLVLRQLGIPAEQAATLVSRAVGETGEQAAAQEIIRVAMRIRSGS